MAGRVPVCQVADNSPDDVLSAFRGGICQKNQELIPAVANHSISSSNGALQQIRGFCQYKISGQMTISRVDILELIHVHHEECERRFPPPGLTDEPGNDLIQGTAVVNFCEWICERLLFDHLRLQGSGNDLFAKLAQFQALSEEVCIKQCH